MVTYIISYTYACTCVLEHLIWSEVEWGRSHFGVWWVSIAVGPGTSSSITVPRGFFRQSTIQIRMPWVSCKLLGNAICCYATSLTSQLYVAKNTAGSCDYTATRPHLSAVNIKFHTQQVCGYNTSSIATWQPGGNLIEFWAFGLGWRNWKSESSLFDPVLLAYLCSRM